ncbi:MAG: ABC transporter substrate binding protein [Desulfuromonadaceae bacterium]|nr:ABC transporter substrate binding protein [Desulfuromonadaceae bacterium]
MLIPIRTFRAVLAFLITSALFCLAAPVPSTAAEDGKANRVLYLNSYDRGFKWSDDIESGLAERFKSADRKIELSVEYLDARRFPGSVRYDSLATALSGKYDGYKHDLVVVSDNFAFDFATQYRKQLFPKLPIVFCGYNNFRPNVLKGISNVTGVNEEIDFAKTIQLAIRVQPSLRTLAFITSTGDPSTRRNAEVVETQLFPELSKSHNLVVLKDASLAEIRARLGALPPDSAVFLPGVATDLIDGRRLTSVENGRMISETSPVPVYSFWDFHLGTGVLGGHIITGLDQGRTAADIALRILGGTPADSIPVIMQTPASTIFDFNVMNRYGIKMTALPEGSLIINQPLKLWGHYKEQIILAAACAFLVMSALSVALLLLNRRLKRTQDEVMKSEEKFRNLFNNSETAMFRTMLDGSVVLDVNQKFLDMLGMTREETIGKPSAVLWADPKEREEMVRRLVADGRISDYEFRMLDRQRGIKNCITSLVLYREQGILEGSILDITERKQAERELFLREQALANSERFLKTIIDSEPECIKMLDIDGNLLMMNRAGLEMIEADSFEQVKGKCVCPLITDPYRDAFMVLTKQVFQGIPGILEFETIGLKGGHIWLETHAVPFRNEHDEIVALLGITRNITERKRAEEDRVLLERQLLQAQKMESLGVLAGGIAHDFNNILTSIVGNTELALMRLNPESPAIDNLKRIEKSAVRATDLAKQMLAYSGKGKFVVETIDINRLVQEMEHMLDVSISKKAIFRYNLNQPLPSVQVDATQIRQVVMNLVINASEAIGERNGVIAITTGCMDCDKNYLKNVVLDTSIKTGRYVYLEITDTGCGMDKETLAKVYDPFFTTKFTGRGLGMAAVQGIVRGHNGFITVYSEPDRGTTFKVFLPASGKMVLNSDLQTQRDDWRGEGKVLLVDDEETVRDIGREMLQELGFTVISANDGNEAIKMFKAIPGIDFVILDLTMPQMDGEECFRELKQLKSDLKVVISSGFSEQEVSQKFAGKGMAGFIQKPYTLSVLKEAIQKI